MLIGHNEDNDNNYPPNINSYRKTSFKSF